MEIHNMYIIGDKRIYALSEVLAMRLANRKPMIFSNPSRLTGNILLPRVEVAFPLLDS
jgi:hypothetical protein